MSPRSHIASGGYIEQSEAIPEIRSDDDSIAPGDIMHRVTDLAIEASQKFGKNIMIAPHIKRLIEEAGFVDVRVKQYKWPIGEWPMDRKLKDIGRWNLRFWVEGLESFTLRLLTQYCGVSQSLSSLTASQILRVRRAITDWRTVDDG